MIVPEDLKNRVAAKVRECFVVFFGDSADRFDINIVYRDDMKNVGGYAIFNTSTIELNSKLFLKNVDEYFSEIIPHEAAHLIADIKYPEQRHIHHGKAWKSVMRKLGHEPRRCHNLDTTHVFTKSNYRYVCGCDGKTFSISKILHDKLKSGDVRLCRNCDTRVIHFPVGDTYS